MLDELSKQNVIFNLVHESSEIYMFLFFLDSVIKLMETIKIFLKSMFRD